MKKIALSVLVASTVALAACGGGAAPTNNVVSDAMNTNAEAMNDINAAQADGMNTLNAATTAATNEIHAATNDLNSAVANVAAAH